MFYQSCFGNWFNTGKNFSLACALYSNSTSRPLHTVPKLSQQWVPTRECLAFISYSGSVHSEVISQPAKHNLSEHPLAKVDWSPKPSTLYCVLDKQPSRNPCSSCSFQALKMRAANVATTQNVEDSMNAHLDIHWSELNRAECIWFQSASWTSN